MNKETRTFTTELRSDGNTPKICGYFIRFDDIYDAGSFTESVERAALESEIDKDIRILIDHDSSKILGRTGAGTARLSIDDTGVYAEVDINQEDTEAMNAYRRVKRGDWNQASFGFKIIDQTSIRSEDGRRHNVIKKIELYELSVVTFPAYQNTKLEARKKELNEEVKMTEETRSLKDEIAKLKEDLQALEELKALLPSKEAKEVENKKQEILDEKKDALLEEAEDAILNSEEPEEAPVEEAPVEEAPVEETPVEEAPVEEAPVEEVVEEKTEDIKEEVKEEVKDNKDDEDDKNKKKNRRSAQVKINNEEKENSEMENRSIVENTEVRSFIENVKDLLTNRASNSTVINPHLTIPDVMLPIIKQLIRDNSVIYKLVTVKSIKGDARMRVLGRVNEALYSEMCATITNPINLKYALIEFDAFKVSSMAEVCKAYLEDNDVDLYNEIVNAIAQSIVYAVDKGILFGKGAANKMPTGIYQSVADANIVSTSEEGIGLFKELLKATALIKNDFFEDGLACVMNRKTYTELVAEAMSINANGAIVTGVNNMVPVVGCPAVLYDQMPDNVICMGYFSAYTLIERKGIQVSSSEEYHFLQDTVVFKGTMRLDGRPVVKNAFALIGINGTTPNKETDIPKFAGEEGYLSSAEKAINEVV